jgi:hypothetical protein
MTGWGYVLNCGSQRTKCPPPDDTRVNTEQQLNDTESRKSKDSEKSLFQSHCVHHKPHTAFHGQTPATIRPCCGTTSQLTKACSAQGQAGQPVHATAKQSSAADHIIRGGLLQGRTSGFLQIFSSPESLIYRHCCQHWHPADEELYLQTLYVLRFKCSRIETRAGVKLDMCF